ncbi:MAG: hypothetical protein ACK2UO_13865 [Caldilineaceae bacterium]
MAHIRSITIGTIILSCSCVSHGNEDNQPLIEMLATAKVSGMCGVFGQMARFQESTQLKNGDQFVTRFAFAEAARIGQTL